MLSNDTPENGFFMSSYTKEENNGFHRSKCFLLEIHQKGNKDFLGLSCDTSEITWELQLVKFLSS